MKGKLIALGLAVWGLSAAAQETDDMYFSKKDRANQPKKEVFRAIRQVQESPRQEPVFASRKPVKRANSVAGYTGRTVNPDYVEGDLTVTTTSNYFIPNYEPVAVNQNLNQGSYNDNNFWRNNRWNSPFMGTGFYNGYSSYYPNSGWGNNAWGYNGYDPYGYNSYGWSGYNNYNGWNCGPGWNYGMSFGSMSGWGGWLSYNNFYNSYPRQVVVITNPDNNVGRISGKRPTRSSTTSRELEELSSGSTAGNSTGNTNPRGGRVSTSGNSTTDTYYKRGWRQDPDLNTSRSAGRSGTSGTSTSGTTSNSGSRSSRSSTGWSNWGDDSFGGGSFGGGSSGRSMSTGSSGGRSSSGSTGSSGSSSSGRSSGSSRGRN